MSRTDVWYLIRRFASNAGIETAVCCHNIRATGITDCLSNGARATHGRAFERENNRPIWLSMNIAFKTCYSCIARRQEPLDYY